MFDLKKSFQFIDIVVFRVNLIAFFVFNTTYTFFCWWIHIRNKYNWINTLSISSRTMMSLRQAHRDILKSIIRDIIVFYI